MGKIEGMKATFTEELLLCCAVLTSAADTLVYIECAIKIKEMICLVSKFSNNILQY